MKQTKSETLLNQVTENKDLILQNKKELGFYIEYAMNTTEGEKFYTVYRDMKEFGENRISVQVESRSAALFIIKSQDVRNWEVKESSWVTRHPILSML